MKVRKIKSKLILSWYISYLAILAVLLITMIAIYTLSTGQLKKSMQTQNEIVLSYICDDIDQELSRVEKMLAVLAIDRKLEKIKQMRLPLTNEDNHYLYQYFSDFNPLKGSQVLSQPSTYIYFGNIDTIFSAVGRSSIEGYFQTENLDNDMQITTFHDFLTKTYNGDYVKLGNSPRQIYYIKTISEAAQGEPVNCFYKISSLWVESLTDDLYLKEHGIFIISDTEGNEFFRFSSDANRSREIDGEWISFHYHSTVNSWNYTYYLPESLAYQNITMIKLIFLMSMLACVVGVYIMIRFFVKKNYKPVSELTEFFKDRDSSNINNEYLYLHDMITEIFKERNLLLSKADKQEEKIAKYAIMKLIYGHSLTVFEYELLDQYGFDFEDGNFIVVRLKPYNFAEIFFDKNDMSSENEKAYMAEYIICNILSELFTENDVKNVYFSENGAIIYITQQVKESVPLDTVLEMANNFIKSNFNFEFSAAIGAQHSGEGGIMLSYNEAILAEESMTITASPRICNYNGAGGRIQNIFGYSIELEKRLTEMVKLGIQKKVHEIINSIFNRAAKAKWISPDEIKLLAASLNTTAIRILYEKGITDDNAFVGGLGVMRGGNLEELRRFALETFDALCEMSAPNSEIQKKRLEDIAEYVRKNYNNPALNVSGIADAFSINSHYLSSLFKKNMGKKLIDYLNEIRIEKAKKLLLETDDKVRDISEKVGFYSYRTFVRVFTDISGMSPTAYRENRGDDME